MATLLSLECWKLLNHLEYRHTHLVVCQLDVGYSIYQLTFLFTIRAERKVRNGRE